MRMTTIGADGLNHRFIGTQGVSTYGDHSSCYLDFFNAAALILFDALMSASFHIQPTLLIALCTADHLAISGFRAHHSTPALI